MGVSVVMPAFNEAKKIGEVLASMPAAVHGHRVDVLVIDDGSTDGTGQVARRFGARVIRHEPNQGKGAALCAGMEELRLAAGVDAVVWMDSDGQHLPGSLPDVVGPVILDDVDLCVGSRYLDQGQPNTAPLNRRLVRIASVRAVEAITGYSVTDPFSGFRCFSAKAVLEVALEGCGYESELESTFDVARAGLTFREVAIPRIYGPDTSKMGHKHGRLRGRAVVVAGYARTILRAWRDSDRPVKVPVRV